MIFLETAALCILSAVSIIAQITVMSLIVAALLKIFSFVMWKHRERQYIMRMGRRYIRQRSR